MPSLARFLTADTVVPDGTRPQSYNRYSYGGNSPVNFVDPSGHSQCIADKCGPSQLNPNPIWVRSFIDDPDWVQFYGYTVFAGRNYSSDQHSGLDYGKGWSAFGEKVDGNWDFSSYGTDSKPLIPVYAACYCTYESTDLIDENYAAGRVNLSHPDYPGLQLIYGHLINIPTDLPAQLTPNTIIGYLAPPDDNPNDNKEEQHVHVEIRLSNNHHTNPTPYLALDLQEQLTSFAGTSNTTIYRGGYPDDIFNQPGRAYNLPVRQPASPPLHIPQHLRS